MAYKTAKNLLQNRDTYNAYYGDFRGVDFSSDHTQVHPNRLAYAVNMYKDYASAQGSCIETIAGFRRVVNTPSAETIYGIHQLGEKVLLHVGTKLYEWDGKKTVGVNITKTVALGDESERGFCLVGLSVADVAEITSCKPLGEEKSVEGTDNDGINWYAKGTGLEKDDLVSVTYVESKLDSDSVKFPLMNAHKSVSFVMNGKLYILDGANYLVYGGNVVSRVAANAYIPTTRVGIISDGDENGNREGLQYEQRNLLQPKFKQTFRADGEERNFVVTVQGASVESVFVHGEKQDKGEDFEVLDNDANDASVCPKVIFLNEPPKSDSDITEVFYPKSYKGLRVDYLDVYHENDKTFGYKGKVFLYCDGQTNAFNLSDEIEAKPEHEYDDRVIKVLNVSLYDETLTADDYSVDDKTNEYILTLSVAPTAPEETVSYQGIGFRKDHYGVEITASKPINKIDGIGEITASSDLIAKCTIATVFDGRVFLSGNPMCPNRVFYCGRNDDGVADPSYFGEYDHFAEGSDAFAVKGLVPVADVLCVLKEESGQEGSVYYRTPTETSDNIVPKAYTGAEGIGSLGCVGACANFIDDPVFVSKRGVEAIGQLSVRYERAIEHRSSMVDAKLLNERLDGAFLEVWNGYLLLFADGKVYMADSRQKYADDTGIAQYEWYYLEDIGVYDGQYEAYKYASEKDDACPYEIIGEEYSYVDGAYKDLKGAVANPNGEEVDQDGAYYYVTKGDHKYLCEPTGYMIGGDFKKPTCAKVINGDLYFGTEGGHICKFNFDLRNADGDLPIDAYSFDGRPILCGCATKMDNCGIPHLTKSTEKKSMVIKTKTLGASVLKIKVRTNKKPYEQVTRISSARFDFNELDFSDFSFAMSDQSLFMVREKEKKWVEKQIYLYSDEFCRPFALFYMAYRYSVTGRYKE